MTKLRSSDDPLERLRRMVVDFEPSRDAIFYGGTITELGASYCRLVGLGKRAAIRDVLVSFESSDPVAEIVQIDAGSALAAPYATTAAMTLGQRLFRRGHLSVAPTDRWLGRIVNAFGQPIDGREPVVDSGNARSVMQIPPAALARRTIARGARTGVSAVDLFTPLCIGQRIGIFAGSGVGKSTLLGMLAASENFDVTVVGLVGERGREVKEFTDAHRATLSQKGIVVASTSDESALLRRMAALTAMTVAEYFRDQGRSVLLILDSITRFAQASREIAIAAGEPAVSRGFPPSVFTDLPRLLERAGPGLEGAGDITGIFSVLIDGDDHNDPIADAVRGIVDGHIVLDRTIAAQGRYPAIDIVGSISRLTNVALTPDRQAFANKLRALVGRFEEARDLRAIGGYQPGFDTELDTAVVIVPLLYSMLAQSAESPRSPDIFKDVVDLLKSHGATAA